MVLPVFTGLHRQKEPQPMDVEELGLRVERLEHFLEAVHKDSVERDDDLAERLAALTEAVRALPHPSPHNT
jgi:hypothetical protein